MEIEVERMKMLKAYTVTDPRLAKTLSKYGLSFAKIGKLIGAKKSRVQTILYGQYPISGYDLDLIERRVKEENPKFTLDDFSFKEEGFVSEDGTRMVQCRRCGRWFKPENARMRYCSDYCRGYEYEFHKTEKPYQEETPEEQDTRKAESTYEEARRRHINYGDVQKEHILATEPTVMQRWEAYQRERQCKTSESL